ncbi:MAG: chorismate-binding protein [Kiritimatiellae bacterium]|nr:chorismate-binding protein [Kiritimatiellia bacterium]
MSGGKNQIVICRTEKGQWLRFQKPLEIFSAAGPGEVIPVLEHIEKEVAAKKLYAAGFVSYEAGAAFDPAFKFRPARDFPLLWFGLFRKAEPFVLPAVKSSAGRAPAWKSSVAKEEYKVALRKIKTFIFRGATYQVNYSYRLRAPFRGDALSFFLRIAGRQNVPYAAFVGTGRFAVCSFSPELFFSLDGKLIISRPMKGTLPRGRLLPDDLAQARRLYFSQKDRAENVMIVDMVRNDLGRIADRNTVKAFNLYAVEKYDTVWQMTSSVRARTSAGLADIFRALFPPASITGAPKVQTTRIIAELETTPRRIYTGCIGFLAPGRRAQFNVAIRTALVDRRLGRAEYGVGGGIVWDSADHAEYDECAVKTKVICSPSPDFELLETLLWTPEENYFLPDLHLARLKASAAYFAFPFHEKKIRAALAALALIFSARCPRGNKKTGPGRGRRVRLRLRRSGEFSLEDSPFEPGSSARPKVCLAKHPVASGNVFLYHKTTHRKVYDEARAARPGYDEVILWNEKGEATEFCAANIIVELGGEKLTPPVNCGLLPGTYRQWLLRKGAIREEVIKINMLPQCRRIFLCNSVRKMREVRLETGN